MSSFSCLTHGIHPGSPTTPNFHLSLAVYPDLLAVFLVLLPQTVIRFLPSHALQHYFSSLQHFCNQSSCLTHATLPSDPSRWWLFVVAIIVGLALAVVAIAVGVTFFHDCNIANDWGAIWLVVFGQWTLHFVLFIANIFALFCIVTRTRTVWGWDDKHISMSLIHRLISWKIYTFYHFMSLNPDKIVPIAECWASLWC